MGPLGAQNGFRGPRTREALGTMMSTAALEQHGRACVNINFEGEAEGLTEISRALPSSLGAAESDPSGDWHLLALSLGRESSPGQSWEAWRLASEEQLGSPRHRNSYPGPSPRLLEIFPPGWLLLCQDRALEIVPEALPCCRPSRTTQEAPWALEGWFRARFCH